MKATLEFDLPDNIYEYTHAIRGAKYFDAINDTVQRLTEIIDHGKDSEERKLAFSDAKDIVFYVCESYGFSPWEDF